MGFDPRALRHRRHRKGAARVSPSDMAVFVFSFSLLREEVTGAETLARETWITSELIDKLGLHTFEVFQKGCDDVIRRQQEELLELSTPVIQL